MKYSELDQMSISQLQDVIKEEKGKLQNMKFTHNISMIENPLNIKFSRRLIARAMTCLNAKMAKQKQIKA